MYNESDGGGFFNADTSFGGGSPQVPKKGEQKRAQNIMPVTAKQVLSCSDDGLKIGTLDVYVVTLVGIVRAVETTSVKVTYVLEDNTGCIEGIHWIDGQDESGQTAQPNVVENSYCRLSGTIRAHGDKRYIMAFNIQPIEDANEITSHYLEVALFYKKAEALSSNAEPVDVDGSSGHGNDMGSNLSNSLMTSSVGTTISGLTAVQSKVLAVIQKCPQESGVHAEDIQEQLRGSTTKQDIMSAIEFLCGEGHIYTTVDDFHFKTTDAV